MKKVKCIDCGELKTITATDEQIAKWMGGELIQNAMPNVPIDEREIMISGICGKCFDEMFAEKE